MVEIEGMDLNCTGKWPLHFPFSPLNSQSVEEGLMLCRDVVNSRPLSSPVRTFAGTVFILYSRTTSKGLKRTCTHCITVVAGQESRPDQAESSIQHQAKLQSRWAGLCSYQELDRGQHPPLPQLCQVVGRIHVLVAAGCLVSCFFRGKGRKCFLSRRTRYLF